MDFVRKNGFWIMCGVVAASSIAGLIYAKLTANRNLELDDRYKRTYVSIGRWASPRYSDTHDFPNRYTAEAAEKALAEKVLQVYPKDLAKAENKITAGVLADGLLDVVPVPRDTIYGYAEDRQKDLYPTPVYIPHPSGDQEKWDQEPVRFKPAYRKYVVDQLIGLEDMNVAVVPGHEQGYLRSLGEAAANAVWNIGGGGVSGDPNRVFLFWDWSSSNPNQEEMRFASFEYWTYVAFFKTLVGGGNEAGVRRINRCWMNPGLGTRGPGSLNAQGFELQFIHGSNSTAPFQRVDFEFAAEMDARRYPILIERLGKSPLLAVIDKLRIQRSEVESAAAGEDPVRVYMKGYFLKYALRTKERPTERRMYRR